MSDSWKKAGICIAAVLAVCAGAALVPSHAGDMVDMEPELTDTEAVDTKPEQAEANTEPGREAGAGTKPEPADAETSADTKPEQAETEVADTKPGQADADAEADTKPGQADAETAADTETSADAAAGQSTGADTEIAAQKKAAEEKIADVSAKLPQSALLELEPILQNPELPTGCESVALTMALNSLGFSLEKTEIADNYLIYADNFAKGYVGDPYSEEGAGVFPPGLAETANRFLKDKNQTMRAYDISGEEFSELYAYLAAGYPVVVWVTMDYDSPRFSQDICSYKGKSYQWYYNEHCVLLGGYDLDTQTVTIFDPLEGVLEMDEETVEDIYNETGQNAIVIY